MNLDVKMFIKEKSLSEGFDKENQCEVIDVKKLKKQLIKEISYVKKAHEPEGIIIESHLAHYLPKKNVDFCIITKCDLKKLESRLKKRKYAENKIRENLDSEIFDICLNEAKEMGHYTFVINTTKGIKKESFLQLLGEIDAIKSTGRRVKQ